MRSRHLALVTAASLAAAGVVVGCQKQTEEEPAGYSSYRAAPPQVGTLSESATLRGPVGQAGGALNSESPLRREDGGFPAADRAAPTATPGTTGAPAGAVTPADVSQSLYGDEGDESSSAGAEVEGSRRPVESLPPAGSLPGDPGFDAPRANTGTPQGQFRNDNTGADPAPGQFDNVGGRVVGDSDVDVDIDDDDGSSVAGSRLRHDATEAARDAQMGDAPNQGLNRDQTGRRDIGTRRTGTTGDATDAQQLRPQQQQQQQRNAVPGAQQDRTSMQRDANSTIGGNNTGSAIDRRNTLDDTLSNDATNRTMNPGTQRTDLNQDTATGTGTHTQRPGAVSNTAPGGPSNTAQGGPTNTVQGGPSNTMQNAATNPALRGVSNTGTDAASNTTTAGDTDATNTATDGDNNSETGNSSGDSSGTGGASGGS